MEYLKNYDGDTITFNIKNLHPIIGKRISVRVLGIDTPEIRGRAPCERKRALQAQKRVKGLLSKAKNIELKNVQRGKYFRILADVLVDGESLSQKLIQDGLARHYDGKKKDAKFDWCSERP